MLPIETQLISAIMGDSEGSNTILLSDAYSPGGSVNVWIDKSGALGAISGYLRQNPAAFTTDTGGSAVALRGFHPYRQTTGAGVTTRQLVMVLDDGVNEWELHYSTDNGVTKTLISDLGAGSVGATPDFAQFGTALVITNGIITPRVWNGAALSVAGGTQLAAPTTSNLNPGNLNGDYQWKIVPKYTDGTRGIGSVASTVLHLQDRSARVDWVADSDVNTAGYELYRTSGTGKTYYFAKYIEGRTTVTYDDDLADVDLTEQRVMQEHGDPPPTSYFVEPHKLRAWYGRTSVYPRRAYYSDPGDHDSVYQDENFIDFTDDESLSDVMTGMTGSFKGMLVAWLERSVWRVGGTGQIVGNSIDWTRKRTDAQTGCVSHRAVARIPAGAKYPSPSGEAQTTSEAMLAYFTPLNEIRLFDGNNATVISDPKQDLLARTTYASRAKVWCLTDTKRQMTAWFIPVDGGTECSRAAVWNWGQGTWHEWSDMNFAHGIETESATATQVLLAGEARVATGGFIYQLWNGTTFDGAAMTTTWMTKALYPKDRTGVPDFLRTHRWRFAKFLFRNQGSPVTMTIDFLLSNGADAGAAVASKTVSGDDLKKALVKTGGRFLHDPGIRVRVTRTGAGDWVLESILLGYQTLPGVKRDPDA